METKLSFCQRSPTMPMTANDRDDHDRYRSLGIKSESISAIMNDRQRLQRANGNHQYSDLNDPSDYMEINLQRLQRS